MASIDPGPDGQRCTAVVVLGAGRSGTSALTRGLATLGVDLGDKLRPAGGKNPTGFFEDRDILAISKRLKHALGIRGHSVRLLDDAVWDTPRVRAIQHDAVGVIGERFGDVPLWGYKYGRTLRTLPFWQRIFAALDLDVRYVVALRNPLSVARSRGRINPQRGRQVWSDMEWLVNIVPYFHRVRGRPVSVVDFDRLLAAPTAQLERVARDLRLPLAPGHRAEFQYYAEQFLHPAMPRSRFTRADLARDPKVDRWVTQGYGLLAQVAADERSLEDEDFWSQWGALQADVRNLAPLLEELDDLRARLVRSRWNPASVLTELGQLQRDLRSL